MMPKDALLFIQPTHNVRVYTNTLLLLHPAFMWWIRYLHCQPLYDDHLNIRFTLVSISFLVEIVEFKVFHNVNTYTHTHADDDSIHARKRERKQQAKRAVFIVRECASMWRWRRSRAFVVRKRSVCMRERLLARSFVCCFSSSSFFYLMRYTRFNFRFCQLSVGKVLLVFALTIYSQPSSQLYSVSILMHLWSYRMHT